VIEKEQKRREGRRQLTEGVQLQVLIQKCLKVIITTFNFTPRTTGKTGGF
jgi:hypothetical protein